MAVPARRTSKAKITHVLTVYHLKDTTKDVRSLKLHQLNNRREIPCA